jgi:ABC-type transporter Mla subunit MlaD
VEDAKVGELSKDLKELIKGLNDTVTELDTILKSNDAKQTLANVTAITSDLRTTLNRTDRLLSSREHSVKLTLENIERISEDMRELMETLKKYPSWVLFGNPPPHIEGEDKAE